MHFSQVYSSRICGNNIRRQFDRLWVTNTTQWGKKFLASSLVLCESFYLWLRALLVIRNNVDGSIEQSISVIDKIMNTLTLSTSYRYSYLWNLHHINSVSIWDVLDISPFQYHFIRIHVVHVNISIWASSVCNLSITANFSNILPSLWLEETIGFGQK